jgi:hypothetical protein
MLSTWYELEGYTDVGPDHGACRQDIRYTGPHVSIPLGNHDKYKVGCAEYYHSALPHGSCPRGTIRKGIRNSNTPHQPKKPSVRWSAVPGCPRGTWFPQHNAQTVSMENTQKVRTEKCKTQRYDYSPTVRTDRVGYVL